MLLEVENVSKTYGTQLVLDHVCLSEDAGHIVGLLGPNGAGKSTLMKCITGFIRPDEGRIEIDGRAVGLDTAHEIGYLPEHNPLYTEMYVREYLEFVGRTYKVADLKPRIEEVIRQTGLSAESRKRIGQLSKGYRQRVGLAAAIIHRPSVLILDEPTTGLDPNQLVEVRDLIRTLGSSRLVVLSTHIMQEVEAMCDSVVLIDHGRMVAAGRTEELMAQYGSIEELFHQMTK